MLFKPSTDAVFYNELPAKCPDCSTPLSPTSPKNSKKANWCVLLGIIVTGAWLFVFFNYIYKGNPDKLYTKQVAGVIILNSWPAFIVGFLASKLPQVVHRKCIKCSWEKTYEIKLPAFPEKN